MRTLSRRLPKQLHAVYLAGFLLNISYAFLVYIQSSYLETYLAKNQIGLLFSLAALLGAILLLYLPLLLRQIGQTALSLSVVIVTIVSIVSMALAESALQIALAFVLFYMAELALWVLLDLYLEHLSSTRKTGDIRGHYLMINSIAFILSPLMVGYLTDALGYRPVYLVSALLLVPLLFLLTTRLRSATQTRFVKASPFTGLLKAWQNRNILSVACTNFLLELFYSVMVIYTPIYLHTVIGLAWREIGLVFTVMLIPFVLLELPLGKLADRVWGEQEMLLVGLGVMTLSTALLSVITSASVFVWALALFATRLGAATIEIMNEAYFFKQVEDRDADVISFYRNARPLAYIIGPLLATAMLAFLPMQYLFSGLAIVILLGFYPAAILKDTK